MRTSQYFLNCVLHLINANPGATYTWCYTIYHLAFPFLSPLAELDHFAIILLSYKTNQFHIKLSRNILQAEFYMKLKPEKRKEFLLVASFCIHTIETIKLETFCPTLSYLFPFLDFDKDTHWRQSKHYSGSPGKIMQEIDDSYVRK